MNKTFSKSDIIPPLELTLDYIMVNYYCSLDTTCFTYAEDNFIRVTSLCDRRLTALNITAQLNQELVKSCNLLYHTNHKAWRRLCYGVGDCNLHQVMEKLRQTNYYIILQHHAVSSGMRLVAQGFVLMKENDPKCTSKLYSKNIKT